MAHGISPSVVTLAPQPADLAAEFHAAGIPVESIALPRQGIKRFPALAWAIYRICSRLRPSAVLSMPLGWHGFTFLGARAAGARSTAAHVGNYPPVNEGAALAKFRLLVQLGRPVTNHLICCSTYIQEGILHHFGIPLSESRVIYNGVDVLAFARRAEAGRAALRGRKGRFVVGMVASLEVHKDQPTLIRAAALAKQAGLTLEIWLVGEGTRRAEYERLIAELDVGDSVKLLGMRRDVAECLGQMDAFVFSAKPDEGLGVALIEAMAASVPIIATDVGACREVLQDGVLGLLVPQGDAAAMAAAIIKLAQGGPPPDRLDQARRRALNTFSIEQMARAYAEALNLTLRADRVNPA